MLENQNRFAVPVTACLWLGTLCSTLEAQDLWVGLSVTEDTGGLFESNFASALRALGDVEVRRAGEEHDVLISVIVLCADEDCARASRYAVSIDVSTPCHLGSLSHALTLGLDQDGPLIEVISSEELQRSARHLSHYVSTRMAWVTSWGREVYERAIRELVAEIDRGCLEPIRLRSRELSARFAGDSVQATGIAEALETLDAWC